MVNKNDAKRGFTPLNRPKRLPAEITSQISHKIKEGIFPPGSKLPSETQLAKDFGVSRNVVREAVASLRQEGWVITRQGVGAYVAEDFEFKTFKIDSNELDTVEGLRSVMELRIEMEVGGAAMAARRRTTEQIEKLGKIMEQMRNIKDNLTEFTSLEEKFHQIIAEATHNSHFSEFMQFLAQRIRPCLEIKNVAAPQDKNSLRKSIRDYEKIYEAIRIGDPDKSRRAAWYAILRTAENLGLRGLQGWEESRMTLIGDLYIPTCAQADLNFKHPKLKVPVGACDTHAHIFGPKSKYPYSPHRSYTPPDAPLTQYKEMLSYLGIERAVIVQPSVYGTDNRATLDAIRDGGDNFRGVVVVDENIDEKEMERMHECGVRGVRINLLYKSGIEVSDVRKMAHKIAPFGWHLQMLVDVSEFSDLDTLAKLPVEVVFDHMGHMPTSIGTKHVGFNKLLRMLAEGKAWAKVSGAYRITTSNKYPYEDTIPYAKAIINSNPDRILWASDWPHPYINVPMPSDADILDLLSIWEPDEKIRNKILVDNPQKLYEFDPV
ncbi:MAG: GntR family transcriptional regulator [Denitrovibrio sp.]|nr:MAG: GntR family transcriptional regulator [Denitrovibrio sp.]